MNSEIQIPNKMAFKIGEVAELLGVKPYVLRYWESEFPQLKPKKSGQNQRMYLRKDVQMAVEIHRLLRDKKFSIAGAKNALRNARSQAQDEQAQQNRAEELQTWLLQAKSILKYIEMSKKRIEAL